MYDNQIQVYRSGELAIIGRADIQNAISSGWLQPTDSVNLDGQWCSVERLCTKQAQSKVNWIGLAFGVAATVATAYAIGSLLNKSKNRARRKKANTEPVPEWKKQEVRERDGYKCVYCSAKVDRGHIDHRNPRCRGGSNRIDNLSLACSPCNLSKGSKTARQFVRGL